MERDLVIRGSVEDSTIPELLRSVCKNKESGILTCFIQEDRKSVYIDGGQIVFATSTSMDDRLGEFLLRTGRITVRGFLDATKNVSPGKRLGAILCENSVIHAEELVEGVREQLRAIVLSLFDAVKGTYELVLKNLDIQEMIMLNSSPQEMIFEGVKTITSWSRISKGIGSFTGVLLPSKESDRVLLNLSLKPEESHLFSLCEKGRFNLEEICGMSYQTNFETCRILWGFLLIGALVIQDALERSSDSSQRAPSPSELEADLHDLVESYNDLYSHIYGFTHQKLGDGADQLVQRAMLQVQGTMPNVTKDVQLDTYGRIDFDTLLRNLSPIPESGRFELLSAALEEIIYAMLFEIGASFGSGDQMRLTEEVQRLRKT